MAVTGGLSEPGKPAGHVVAVDPATGVATTKDGRTLQPAAKNPWYVLMTIAGEPKSTFDKVTIAANRRFWNGWACSKMTGEERAELARRMELDPRELAPLTADERARIAAAFRARLAEPDAEDASDLATVTRAFRALDREGLRTPDPGLGINLSGVHFPRDVALEKWVFGGPASFAAATFGGNAWYHAATFSGDALFVAATFGGDAAFAKAAFGGDASFDNATFGGYVWFDDATFGTDTSFTAATFGGFAWFVATTFGGNARFPAATFGRPASFGSATFGGNASFGAATFGGDAWFRVATFGGYAWFASATFGGVAQFSDGAFDGPANFRQARFRGEVPVFYQRKFHQNTVFTARRECWPGITRENAEDSEQAYTRLRQVMKELDKPDDEAFFGRQELRCKALTGGRFHRLVSQGYGFASDYGFSIGRPLSGLGLVVALGWGLIGSWLKHGHGVPGTGGIWQGLGISFANTFGFLGFHRIYIDADTLVAMPGWLKTLGGVQTVAGVVLLFLLGLGLRNRFRLK